MNDGLWIVPLESARDAALVGGKAASLARLLNSGLPVPPGFAITTLAFTAWREAGGEDIPPSLRARILTAYQAMGRPPVAVRSSATAEDGAEMSMAGQYETLLGVQGEAQLLAAVRRCWESSRSPRVTAYLAERGVDVRKIALALAVQTLVPADAAGVLFTANPRNGRRHEMLLEAAWGIGEAVVSGKVQPDVLTLDRDTGHVLEATIAEKSAVFDATQGEMRPVLGDRRVTPVLSVRDIQLLVGLGRRIEQLYGAPQDIEWALHLGQACILQSRPITTLAAAAAREAVRTGTRTRLHAALDAGQGPWVVHNLGETAPRPTPLTWSVLQRFMSGNGGYGQLLRTVGFVPGPAVESDGFLELIGGRIYMDLRRAPEMFGAGFPFRYDLELLRRDPAAADGPPTQPAGPAIALWRAGRISQSVMRRLEQVTPDFDQRLEHEIIPAFAAWVTEERKRDLHQLSATEWAELWRARERRTMAEFAPHALLPGMLCVSTTARLREFLATHFWNDDPDELLATLSVPARSDATLNSNTGLRELAAGRLSISRWLETYGHRAPEEFELSTPRWSERPAAISALAQHWHGSEDPAVRHAARWEAARSCVETLGSRLSAREATTLQALASQLSRYLPYREDGKHQLMLGYGLLRDLAMEAERRLEVGDGIFLLTVPEIEHALTTGYAPHHLIAERQRRRSAESELILPPLVTRTEVEHFGDPPPIDATAERWKSLPLAGGRASGNVRVLTAPDQVSAGERGFVLVCATTDTGWTPLFASAAAVVVECGGSLSHGAVVAREMGVPAVTLPGATRLFRDGETITVDGQHGWIVRGAAANAISPATATLDSEEVPRSEQPPPPGPREAQAATLRRIGFVGWGVFLLAFFLLPATLVHDPTFAIFDQLLWPLVAGMGKTATVALVAAITATLSLMGQRLLNDHERLVVAKQRSQRLQAQAQTLPDESPRRKRLLAATAGVQTRLTLAAFTPLAVLLGPMVLSFIWLTERIDPAVWNPAPGSTAEVVALVQGDHREPVTLEFAAPLQLAPHSPREQRLPPIRATLDRLLERWQRTTADEDLPWDVRAAASRTRNELLDDLQLFLAQPLPPQSLAWSVALPAGKAGAFPLMLRTAGAEPVGLTLVAGDAAPPVPRSIATHESGPVREVRVDYREPRVRDDRVFWAPLSRFGYSWDAGWLGVYLIVYLPVMIGLRMMLRLP